MAWSVLFRSEGTFANYLGYLKTACLLCKAPTEVLIHYQHRFLTHHGRVLHVQVFEHHAIERAKASIAKRGNFRKRPRRWIRRLIPSVLHYSKSAMLFRTSLCRQQVVEILRFCKENRQYQRYAMLYLFTYIFLLRLPSEALPATIGESEGQTSVLLSTDEITIVLKRRCDSIPFVRI